MTGRRSAGFTLLEMGCVLAIVGLPAAVRVPDDVRFEALLPRETL